jgi:branched-chain amino acid transport system ATP-binding protein
MTSLLEVKNVDLSFGGVQAAIDVNVEIEQGEMFAIIGQNGAGKSTFLNICTGYFRPDSGQVVFQGRDITGMPPRRITRLGIARAFQHPQLFQLRPVLDNMAFAISCHGHSFWQPKRMLKNKAVTDRAYEILALCGLENAAHEIVAKLSEGSRKLLDVALALALEPNLLLLDEPTSGVSSEDKHTVMNTLVEALREQQVTGIFVEHDMDVVERFANRVGVWGNGRMMFCGQMADAMEDPEISGLVI